MDGSLYRIVFRSGARNFCIPVRGGLFSWVKAGINKPGRSFRSPLIIVIQLEAR